MVRLAYSQRVRITSLFVTHHLKNVRGRFHKLRDLAAKEEIYATERTMRRIVKHWQITGSIANKESLTRALKNTKITQDGMEALDKLIYRKRELSALQAKIRLNLIASARTGLLNK